MRLSPRTDCCAVRRLCCDLSRVALKRGNHRSCCKPHCCSKIHFSALIINVVHWLLGLKKTCSRFFFCFSIKTLPIEKYSVSVSFFSWYSFWSYWQWLWPHLKSEGLVLEQYKVAVWQESGRCEASVQHGRKWATVTCPGAKHESRQPFHHPHAHDFLSWSSK